MKRITRNLRNMMAPRPELARVISAAPAARGGALLVLPDAGATAAGRSKPAVAAAENTGPVVAVVTGALRVVAQAGQKNSAHQSGSAAVPHGA